MLNCPYKWGSYREDYDLLICRPQGLLTEDWMRGMVSFENCLPDMMNHDITKRFFDLRGLTTTSLGIETLQRITSSIPKERLTRPTVECFLVSRPLIYGTVKMYQAVVEEHGLQVHVSFSISEIAKILEVEESVLMNSSVTNW